MKRLVTFLLLCSTIVTYSQIISDFGRYNSDGVPEYLESVRDEIRPSLLNDINLLLPDGVKLPTNNPDLYNRNTLNYIKLRNEADVYLSFISEGADFKSAVGFFTFTGSPPISKYIIRNMKSVFPNTSGEGSGGGLRQGDRVKLGRFPAGTSIGFFLVADGFRYGRVMAGGRDIFYTDPKFNPETNDNVRKHTILLYDEETDRYVLLFEDFNRQGGSDEDFNDAIFMISTNEPGVLSTEGAQLIQEEKDKISQEDQEETEEQETQEEENKKITICHFPPGNPDNPQNLEINQSAWPAHENHGDMLGGCPSTLTTPVVEDLNIEGDWDLECQLEPITIRQTANGIRVRSGNTSNWVTYIKTSVNIFEDELGNRYQFENDSTATWKGMREIGPFNVNKINIQDKITICHYPPGNRKNPQQITISMNAWPAHENHGDVLGACPIVDDELEPNSYDIEGTWKLEGRNQLNEIRLTPTGIEVRANRSNKWFLYSKVYANKYQDSDGNVYEFESDNSAVWKSGNGRTVIRLRKD